MTANPCERTSVSVDATRERILAAFAPLPPVSMPLDNALGLTLAEDVVAARALPPFANSAMDGYAMRSSDTTMAAPGDPVELAVTGEIPAGHVAKSTGGPGCAMRIMTGAPIPPETDAVVRVEDTDLVKGDRIRLTRPVSRGENVRPAAEDAVAGEIVLLRGRCVGPNQVGLIAAAGHARVSVHRRPRVAILVTGDEVVAPGETLGPGQIWNSNGPMLMAMVRQLGGDPVDLGVGRDDPCDLRDRIARSHDCDLLITTGGISVGERDLVKRVLLDEGNVAILNVRIKPGKPLAFGDVHNTPVIGLPGNPVAAYVSLLQFARPAILTMLGRRDCALPEIRARVLDGIANRGQRTQFARVVVDRDEHEYTATIAGKQGSAIHTALAAANGLLVIPEDVDVIEPGDKATVQLVLGAVS